MSSSQIEIQPLDSMTQIFLQSKQLQKVVLSVKQQPHTEDPQNNYLTLGNIKQRQSLLAQA
jgi:hypothetical protein